MQINTDNKPEELQQWASYWIRLEQLVWNCIIMAIIFMTHNVHRVVYNLCIFNILALISEQPCSQVAQLNTKHMQRDWARIQIPEK